MIIRKVETGSAGLGRVLVAGRRILVMATMPCSGREECRDRAVGSSS